MKIIIFLVVIIITMMSCTSGAEKSDPINKNYQIDSKATQKNESTPRRGLSIPPYPELARQQGMQGDTVLNLYINTDGKVEQALVTESSGYLILDEAASHWIVENWRFIPCKTKNQEAVACWYPIRHKWRINN